MTEQRPIVICGTCGKPLPEGVSYASLDFVAVCFECYESELEDRHSAYDDCEWWDADE